MYHIAPQLLVSIKIVSEMTFFCGLTRGTASRAAPGARQSPGRAMATGCGVPSAGIGRGDFSMMRGDGEETWNHGPGSSSRSPSARKSGRPIPAGTPHPAQPATNQPPEIRYAAVKGLTALPMFRTRTKSDRLLGAPPGARNGSAPRVPRAASSVRRLGADRGPPTRPGRPALLPVQALASLLKTRHPRQTEERRLGSCLSAAPAGAFRVPGRSAGVGEPAGRVETARGEYAPPAPLQAPFPRGLSAPGRFPGSGAPQKRSRQTLGFFMRLPCPPTAIRVKDKILTVARKGLREASSTSNRDKPVGCPCGFRQKPATVSTDCQKE